MDEKKIDFLLYSVPENVDYTTIPEELDLEDVPQERIDGLIKLLSNENEVLQFDSARLLVHWGIDEGFVLATMQDQVIQIQRIQGAKSGYKLSIYGKVPLAAIYTSGYIPANDSKSMDVTIDFNEADMAVFFFFSPRG